MHCRNFLKISHYLRCMTTEKCVSFFKHTHAWRGIRLNSVRLMASKKFTNKKGEVSNLRHVQYQRKRAGRINPPAIIEAQVVSMGAPGTPRSLIINMDHFKYLFNCGEGTQRISMEHRMKISKVQEVFITRHSWENTGGLLGMCLSLESMNVPSIRIHGPPNVEKLVSMSKGFAQLHKIRIEKMEVSDQYHADSAMHIDYIPLMPSSDETTSDSLNSHDMAVAYLCQPHPRPRNICFEKCVDLGIQKGPVIGQLKRGEEVTLPNGHVIKPEDVLVDAEPNSPFIVLECPSLQHLSALTRCSRLQNVTLQLIVHMTPLEVLMSPDYQSWMASFPADKTKHLVMNEHCSGLVYEGVYRIQAMLGMIHDRVFPAIPEPNTSKQEGISTSLSNLDLVYAETNLKYNIRSKKQGEFNRDQCIMLDCSANRQALMEQQDFATVLQAAKEQLAQNQKQQCGAVYPELLFLGTGSAIPNKVRNVSGILLNLSEDQSILLDCGENSLGQLIRYYGNQVDNILVKLSAIFVSHLHADHHLGIISIVKERKRVLESRGCDMTPLTIVAPARLADWYSNIEQFQVDMPKCTRVIPVEYFYQNPPEGSREVYENFITGLNMKKIELVRVFHRQFPHGVILTHQSGWKLVYSGDTMPCDNLVTAGQNCDLLIHEATMEDDLEEEAKMKKHSTTSQAIDVGMKMSARFILLTHFSQRYAKVPLFNANFSDRVGIAFDNMRVSLSELHLIPYFLPVLKAMFAEEYAEMEERTLKRSYKKVAAGGGEGEQQSQKRQKNKGRDQHRTTPL